MKIFLAGATGALGRRLLPQLIWRGHQVVASTTQPAKVRTIARTGATPVVMDALNREEVDRVVRAAQPEVIVHQMTALSRLKGFRNLDRELALTNRLRTEGTRNLWRAGEAAGARRFVAQSYTGWTNDPVGARVKTESDGLVRNPPRTMRRSLEAIRTLESMVTTSPGISGIILRYASFYGPGTAFSPGGQVVELIRRRQLPVVGSGGAVWSFIHIDDAAAATVAAIESEHKGIFHIADDDPAEVSVWLPELARAIGAPEPRHLPSWIARLAIGQGGVYLMTRARGVSNHKAKRTLGWHPGYGSWREGFRQGLSSETELSYEEAGTT